MTDEDGGPARDAMVSEEGRDAELPDDRSDASVARDAAPVGGSDASVRDAWVGDAGSGADDAAVRDAATPRDAASGDASSPSDASARDASSANDASTRDASTPDAAQPNQCIADECPGCVMPGVRCCTSGMCGCQYAILAPCVATPVVPGFP